MTIQENMIIDAMDSYMPTNININIEKVCNEIINIMENNIQYCDISTIIPGKYIIAKLKSERLIEGYPSLRKSIVFKDKSYNGKYKNLKEFFNSFNEYDFNLFSDDNNKLNSNALKYRWVDKFHRLLIDEMNIEELAKTYKLKSQRFDIMNIAFLLASKGYMIKDNILTDIMSGEGKIKRSYRIVLYKYCSYDKYMSLKNKRG